MRALAPGRRVLTKQEFADALAVDTRTIERLVRARRVFPVRIGRAIRFTPEELERFLAESVDRRGPAVDARAVPAVAAAAGFARIPARERARNNAVRASGHA
jgi:excisionase family DNA binding protein